MSTKSSPREVRPTAPPRVSPVDGSCTTTASGRWSLMPVASRLNSLSPFAMASTVRRSGASVTMTVGSAMSSSTVSSRRRLALVRRLGDAAGGDGFDLGPDSRALVQQGAEILARKHQQMAVAVGRHVGVAWAGAQKSHLADEIALLQHHRPEARVHGDLAGGDEVHRIGRPALADDL